jgi:hypothetical protein
MSHNDTSQLELTAQSLLTQLLLALIKYQRAHQGRSPACIQLNGQALGTLQPTDRREWLRYTGNGWMFYDIPVLVVLDQADLFVFCD